MFEEYISDDGLTIFQVGPDKLDAFKAAHPTATLKEPTPQEQIDGSSGTFVVTDEMKKMKNLPTESGVGRNYIEVKTTKSAFNENGVKVKDDPEVNIYYEDEWKTKGYEEDTGYTFNDYVDAMNKSGVDLSIRSTTSIDESEENQSQEPVVLEDVKITEKGRNKINYAEAIRAKSESITFDNYEKEATTQVFDEWVERIYNNDENKEYTASFDNVEDLGSFWKFLTTPISTSGDYMLMDKQNSDIKRENSEKFKQQLKREMPSELYDLFEKAGFQSDKVNPNDIKNLMQTDAGVNSQVENFLQKTKKQESIYIADIYADKGLTSKEMQLAVPFPNPEWNRIQDQTVIDNEVVEDDYRKTLAAAGVPPSLINNLVNKMEYGVPSKIPQTSDYTFDSNASLFKDETFTLTDPASRVPENEKQDYFDGLYNFQGDQVKSFKLNVEAHSEKMAPLESEIIAAQNEIKSIDINTINTPAAVAWYDGLVDDLNQKLTDYAVEDKVGRQILTQQLEYVNDVSDNIMKQAGMMENVALAAYATRFNYDNVDKFLATFETELVAPAMVLGAKVINSVASGASTLPGATYYAVEALSKGEIPGGMLTMGGDVTGLEGRAVDYYDRVTTEFQEEFPTYTAKISDVFDEKSSLTFGNWLTGAVAENGLTIVQVLGPSLVARASISLTKQALKKKVLNSTTFNRAGEQTVSAGAGYYKKKPKKELFFSNKDLDSKLFDLTIKKNALENANRFTMASFFTATGGGEMGRLEANYKKAGQQLSLLQEQLKNTNDPAEQNEILSQIDYYTNLSESSKWQRTLQGTLFGVTEMYAEKWGSLRYVNNLRVTKKLAAKKGLDDVFVKGWNKSAYWGNRVKDLGTGTYNLGYGVGVENVEEILTAMGHGLIKKGVMDSNDPIMKDVNWDLIANTTFSSLIMQGPSTASQVTNMLNYEMSTYKDYAKSVKYATQRANLTKQIESLSTTPEKRRELEKERGNLDQFIRLETVDKQSRFKRMRPATQQRYLELRAQQNFLEKELYSLASSGRFGEKGFAEEYEAAKKRVINGNNQLQDVFNNTKDKAALNLKRKQLKALNEKDGTNYEFVNLEVANANRMLNQSALDLAELLSEKDIIQIDSEEEAKQYIKDNNINDETAEQILNMPYAFNDPNGNIYINTSSINSSLVGVNAMRVDKALGPLGLAAFSASVIALKENTGLGIENFLQTVSNYEQFRAAIAPLHEVMHDEIDRRKIFSGIFPEAKNAALGITNYLTTMMEEGNLDRGVYDKMMNVLKKYNIDSDTKAEDKDVDVSEILTVLGEAVLGGYINSSDIANMHGLKSFMNNLFQKKFGNLGKAVVDITDPFGTPQAMVDFMKEYVRKQVMQGKINSARIPEEEKKRLQEDTSTNRQSVTGETNARDTEIGKNLRSQFTNEQLLRKLKNSTSVEKAAIEDILLDAAARVGLKTMGFDTRAGLGNITYAEAYNTARARVAERKLLEKFNPNINDNWSTYAGSQLRFDLTDVLEENKKKLDTESTDSEAAKQVVDESQDIELANETAVEDVEAVIDIYDILPTEIKEKAQQEVNRKIKENNIDLSDDNLTYKELTEIAPYETLAEYFGIPVSRITMPTDNLRKGDDISDIQRFILKNVDKLIRTRPRGNADLVQTQKVGSIKAKVEGGQSAGIRSRNFLNTEYDKVLNDSGKQKKVNNNLQYKIKPGDRARFLTSSGITNNKLDPNFVPRSAESQYIKGVLELLARNMALTSFGKLVDQQQDQKVKEGKTTKEKADTRKSTVRVKTAPAKAPLLRFSAVAEKYANEGYTFVRGEFNLADNATKRIDGMLKDLQLDPTYDITTPDGRTKFIEKIKLDLLPIMPRDFWFSTNKEGKVTASAFTASNANYGISKSKDPAGFEAYETFRDEIYAIGNNTDTKYGASIEVTNSDGKVETVDWSLTKNYQTIFGKKGNYLEKITKGIDNGDIEKWNKNVALIHKEMWKRFAKVLADKKTRKEYASIIGTYLKLTASDSTSWHRLGAQFIGYSESITKRKEGKSPNIEFEHAMPATAAYIYLLDAALQDNIDFNTAYDVVIDNYKMIVLDKAMDDKLKNARTAAGFSLMFRMPDNWNVVTGNWWQRYFNDTVFAQDGGIDPSSIKGLDGKTFADIYGINAQGQPTTAALQNDKAKAAPVNRKITPKQVLPRRNSVSNNEILNKLDNLQKAFTYAQNPNNEKKGISVYDFDDTLAISKSEIIVTMPNGKVTKITPAKFATDSVRLENEGAQFNFEEFNKVVDGKKGPLANRLRKAIDKFGNKNIFVLTARPAESAPAIYDFLQAIGMELPLNNIIGLENGDPQAKASWIVSKAAEGYNDFYFVDDAVKNVKAVKDALNVLDVNSKVQVARKRNSVSMNDEFNKMIERKTGIKSFKEFSKTKAELIGAQKKAKKFFIPASADDFVGLLYSVLGKGKQGDADLAWIKENLLDPYAVAMQNVSLSRITLQNDYKALKKALNIVPKDLKKLIPGSVYTKQNAVRVYMWDKLGYNIPGISKTDLKEIKDYINENEYLEIFGNELIAVLKGQEVAKPKAGWLGGTVTTDLLDSLMTNTRTFYLQDWQRNVDVIFSEANLNKLEAAFGNAYRVALENILGRMKSGINRNFKGDSLTGKFTDWMTNGIGVIMFFNTRSALLQTISAVNFINLEDNNILAASKAFANQPQFWKDFMSIMNSPFLKERRGGLRFNVNESDIADMAKKDGMKGVVAKLLQLGFLPTQFADSLAIASGGATMYRNRINTYLKEGMSEKEAQEKAFIDFREIAEESQQSSRPDRISMQQSGPLGRLILAFANTPMQYARLIGKSIDDIKNRRGNWKANTSKLIHYALMQNLIFTATQQALFAIGMGDLDDEEEERKITNTANNMMDSLLRGLGFAGAVASVIKNTILKGYTESEKKTPKYEKLVYELFRISPPISSKISRVQNFNRTLQWDQDKIAAMGWDIQNPGFLAAASLIAASTNIPLDRLIIKAKNIDDAMSNDLEMWERLFLLGGWRAYELGVEEKIRPRKSRGRKKKKKANLINGGVKIKGVKLN